MPRRQNNERAPNQEITQACQDTVNHACAAILLQLAVDLKLIKWPRVNLERCEEILLLESHKSIKPENQIVFEILQSWLKEAYPETACDLATTIWGMAVEEAKRLRI